MISYEGTVWACSSPGTAMLLTSNHIVIIVTKLLRFLENVSHRPSRTSVIVRPSVCRVSVTFVHPTQAIEIFGNVSTP